MISSIAPIHVAKKQLGLDDDTYRAKLQVITGKSPVKDVAQAEREKVITAFRQDGLPRRSHDERQVSGVAPMTVTHWTNEYVGIPYRESAAIAPAATSGASPGSPTPSSSAFSCPTTSEPMRRYKSWQSCRPI